MLGVTSAETTAGIVAVIGAVGTIIKIVVDRADARQRVKRDCESDLRSAQHLLRVARRGLDALVDEYPKSHSIALLRASIENGGDKPQAE